MERPSPAVHRTIVVVDVERFGDRRRTSVHQVAVRAGLYQVLRRAFEQAGVLWNACDHEDRGDGVVVLVPAETPKALFVDAVPHALAKALREHNNIHAVEARIRLRMAVHAGEVIFDQHGFTATAVNMAFRLLDAAPLKTVLAESPGVLAVITSGWFFDEVVRHSPACDAATYRPVRISVKETSTVAWIGRPDHPYPPAPAYFTGPPAEYLAAPDPDRYSVSRSVPGPIAGQLLDDPSVPRQLPLAIRDFTGRTEHLAVLDALASDERDSISPSGTVVIAIDGTAGVGKTTLAVYWAHRVQDAFPDGTLFANLFGHGPRAMLDPTCVLASFLRALGMAEERLSADLDVLVGLYRSLVAERRMLILLDNAGSADQVRPLLPGAPGCVTVVTSRAKLTGLVVAEAAHRVALDLFTRHEATNLVRGVVGTDRVAAEPEAAAELIRLCAGLPLAVRVAASRVAVRRHTSIADVVEDIAHPHTRLDMLSGVDDSTAVRAVLDWSYTALPAEQARVFRLLGWHPLPEFGVHAAAALAGLDLNRASRILEALVDVHLLEPVGRRRYRCHDLLHVYASERAELDTTPGDRRRALGTMVTWYAQTATIADRLVFPANPALSVDLGAPVPPIRLTDREEAWSWLTTECDAVLAALRYAAEHRMTAVTLALAAATRFLAMRPRAMWHHRLTAETHGLLAAEASGDRTAEAAFRGSRADTHQMMGHWAESDADLDRLAELAQELHDRLLRGEALCGMGRNRKLQHLYP
jgi:hypothetical protein